MATTKATESSPSEVSQWLQSLPVAPEYHPTLAEFQDPISYIFKIEKEASQYGICKIVPPLSPASKNTVISNFNRSIAARNPSSDSKSPPTFITLQQKVGESTRKSKAVWRSGETYTFKAFEAKAKKFEKNYLKRSGKKSLSELEIDSLYLKALVDDDENLSVECANDLVGSAFAMVNGKKLREAGDPMTVGETPWNMRGVSRAKGSLLRFMKEEIPGMTSPIMYLAMLFSWFGWHVENHDLHSLDYIHMGSGKTWYGVPKEAAVAFEEVVRVHGYGGEVNHLVSCATLAEKTTIISPEVLIASGIPCCRLVQNAGEFVVTFPRAYHSGFSHGFNCSETANIATPEWLKVAKEAAVRRALINHPPMVSHFQLLYALARSFCCSIPLSISTEPRSSRLKEKERSEGETMVKELFVQNVIQNNELLHVLLEQGSSCVFLPQKSSNIICSNRHVESKIKINSGVSHGNCSSGEETGKLKTWVSEAILRDSNSHISSTSVIPDTSSENNTQSSGILDRGIFSCVTCGILSFPCAAVIQPTEAAAEYFMSSDCSVSKDSGAPDDEYTDANWSENTSELNSCSGRVEKTDHVYDVQVQCDSSQVHVLNENFEDSGIEAQKGVSALNLLAAAYGYPSDSEDEEVEPEIPVSADGNSTADSQKDKPEYVHEFISSDNSISGSLKPGHCDEEAKSMLHSSCSVGGGNEIPVKVCYGNHGRATANMKGRSKRNLENSLQSEMVNLLPKDSKCSKPEKQACGTSDFSLKSTALDAMPNYSPISFGSKNECSNVERSIKYTQIPFEQKSGEESCKKHIFCLEHAVEVRKQLRSVGGVHMLLVCYRDYPRVETEAKALAAELGINYGWKDIPFREATNDDEAKIQSALNAVEVVSDSGDWAVKLGTNVAYSASLSQSPLYSKQMPCNLVISRAFGCVSPTNSSVKPKVFGKRPRKHNKIVVAGNWCGKIWMSDQVHPCLTHGATQEALIHFHSRATPEPKDKPESDSEPSDETEQSLLPRKKSIQSMTTTVTRKSERKRKGTLEKEETMEPKCSQQHSPIGTVEDSPTHSSPPCCDRILGSGQMKRKIAPLCNNRIRNIGRCDSDVKQKEVAPGRAEKRLRRKPSKLLEEVDGKPMSNKQTKKKTRETALACSSNCRRRIKEEEAEYQCDMDECRMGFSSKKELMMHKRNICSEEGCGKKLFSHKYLVQHKRVHIDDRPLMCPWKGCKMTFKWSWARTEHIRVHTGVRPYECQEPGCGQTFRFVTDFSRHRRKTGHSVKKDRE